jgi:hypothetical protein
VSIKPFRSSLWDTESNPFAQIFITSEQDSLGDTIHQFHQYSHSQQTFYSFEINDPSEIVAAEGGQFLLQPLGDITVNSIKDTVTIIANDTTTDFYCFYLDYKDNLHSVTVISNKGSRGNADIFGTNFIYIPQGDSSTVNGKTILHNSNDLVYIHGSWVAVLRGKDSLTATIDLKDNDYSGEEIFINDTIESISTLSNGQLTNDIHFTEGGIQYSRSLGNNGRHLTRQFDYTGCEIFSNTILNRGVESSNFSQYFRSNLYDIVGFKEGSSLTSISNWSNQKIEKKGRFYPKNILSGSYWLGGIKKSKQKKITLYPNPSKGRFTLKTDQNISGTFTITDAHGLVVQSDVILGNQFSLANEVPNGVYFFKLISSIDRAKYTGKIILIR